MPLPAGTWKLNLSGTEGDFAIGSPDQHGVFTANLSNFDLKGFWDEASQTIVFSVTVAFDGQRPIDAVFRGHLFRTPPNAEPGRDVVATLVGSVQMTVGDFPPGTFPVIGQSRRNVFGWFAQIAEVL